MPSPRLTSLALAAALTIAAGGCGNGASSPPDGASAALMVFAIATTPDPPTVGQNTMHIEVHRGDGGAVAGARVVVDPQMPAHGHGSSELPRITDEGEGRYRAFPVTFQMPGAWRVRVEVTAGDDTQAAVVDYDVR